MAQSQEGQQTVATVLREIDLGRHHLFLLSDQSIDLMRDEQTPYVADNVLSLDDGEAYRLMISLQEMFQEARE
jgi:signal transduction histidine kinase